MLKQGPDFHFEISGNSNKRVRDNEVRLYLNWHVFVMFSATFYEGDNIYDFLFALLYTKLLLKRSTLKEKCTQ